MLYKVLFVLLLVLASAEPVRANLPAVQLSAYSVAQGENVVATLSALPMTYDLWLCEEGGSDHFLLAADVATGGVTHAVTVTVPYAAPVGQYRVDVYAPDATCGSGAVVQSELLSVTAGATATPTATATPSATPTATPAATATVTPTLTPGPTAALSYGELGQLIDINAGLSIAKQLIDFIGPGNIRDYLVLGAVIAALFSALKPPTPPTTPPT